MGKGKQGASKTEGVCATDAATAYKQGLKLCGEGAYGKALCVSPATVCTQRMNAGGRRP